AERPAMARPVMIGARGADVRLRNVRLYRDIHYSDVRRHGSGSGVRLAAGEYFDKWVLSPNSYGGWFWCDADGCHLPARTPELIGRGRPRRAERFFMLTAVELGWAVALSVLLYLLFFRAFIIPTGAMAETLWGYQKQGTCPQCGHEFVVNASAEAEDRAPPVE